MNPKCSLRAIVLILVSLLILPQLGSSAARSQDTSGDSLTFAQSLRLLKAAGLKARATELQRQGKYAEAALVWEELLAICREVLGEESRAYAHNLNNLAEVYREQGQYSKAEPLYRRAQEILKKVSGEEREDYAAILHNFGLLHMGTGDYDQAEALLQRALAIKKRVLRDYRSDPDYAMTVQSLAELYYKLGDFAHGETHSREAVEMLRRICGERDLRYGIALDTRAKLFASIGDYNKAEVLLRESQEIIKQDVGPKHPLYAISLQNLASVLESTGDDSEAERLYRESLKVLEDTLSPNHSFRAAALGNLAALHYRAGDYDRALSLLEQAIEIRRTTLGESHPEYAASLNDLAELHQRLGYYARAKTLYEKALQRQRDALGDDHYLRATMLANLSRHYEETGDFGRAKALLSEAVDISLRNVDLAAVAASERQQLAMVADLRRFLDSYLSLSAHTGEAERITYDLVLHWKGNIFARQRLIRLARAEPTLESKFRELEQISTQLAAYALGGRPETADVDWRRKIDELTDHKEALERSLARSCETYRKPKQDHRSIAASIQQVLSEGTALVDFLEYSHRTIQPDHRPKPSPEPAQIAVAASGLDNRFEGLGVSFSYPKDWVCWGAESFDRMRRFAEHVGEFNIIALAKGPEDIPVLQIARTKNELSFAAFYQGKKEVADDVSAGGLEVLGQQYVKYDLQRVRLGGHRDALSVSAERADGQTGISYMCLTGGYEYNFNFIYPSADEAKNGEKLRNEIIATLRIHHQESPAPKLQSPDSDAELRVVAFVVRWDRPVVRVDLGPQQDIAKAVERWRSDLEGERRPTGNDDQPAARVRNLLWEPLEQHLTGIERVLISPDGVLGRLPWAAVPSSNPDRYLLDDLAIAVIPVPQLLPQLMTSTRDTNATHEAARSILLVGNVDFDDSTAETPPHRAQEQTPDYAALASISRSAARGEQQMRFDPLPGTVQEVRQVKDVFSEAFPDGRIRLLERAAATEEAFRNEARGTSFLHVATHGFFAPQRFRSALDIWALFGFRFSTASRGPAQNVAGWHPGLLSGLALAGANAHPSEPGDDGILTALEAASLDFHETEMVVLSACDTGLGKVAGGEGLLGLQRAFQLSGARSVVASLWRVDDQATQQLMAKFYQNLWRERMEPIEALRQAQLDFLHTHTPTSSVRGIGPARPLPEGETSPKRASPRLWAAWVLSGYPGDLAATSAQQPTPDEGRDLTREIPKSREPPEKPSPTPSHLISWGASVAVCLLAAVTVFCLLRRRSRQGPLA